MITHHLSLCRGDYPKCVDEIERKLYVDDLLTWGSTVEKAKERKALKTGIFGQATFFLHKWHSNIIELELDGSTEKEDELTYAKQQLGV